MAFGWFKKNNSGAGKSTERAPQSQAALFVGSLNRQVALPKELFPLRNLLREITQAEGCRPVENIMALPHNVDFGIQVKIICGKKETGFSVGGTKPITAEAALDNSRRAIPLVETIESVASAPQVSEEIRFTPKEMQALLQRLIGQDSPIIKAIQNDRVNPLRPVTVQIFAPRERGEQAQVVRQPQSNYAVAGSGSGPKSQDLPQFDLLGNPRQS